MKILTRLGNAWSALLSDVHLAPPPPVAVVDPAPAPPIVEPITIATPSPPAPIASTLPSPDGSPSQGSIMSIITGIETAAETAVSGPAKIIGEVEAGVGLIVTKAPTIESAFQEVKDLFAGKFTVKEGADLVENALVLAAFVFRSGDAAIIIGGLQLAASAFQSHIQTNPLGATKAA